MIVSNEKEILERTDIDVLHAILKNEESVSEAEVQFMRSFFEPVTFLFRGIHEVEKLLRKQIIVRVPFELANSISRTSCTWLSARFSPSSSSFCSSASRRTKSTVSTAE